MNEVNFTPPPFERPDLVSGPKPPSRALALLALILLVPVPSIGTALAMMVPATEGAVGRWCFAAAKIWITILPAFWLMFVLKKKWSWSRPQLGGFGVAALLGVALSAAILATYFLFGDAIVDPQMIREAAARNEIDSLTTFITFGIGVSLANSLMEEYVWRWFVFRQCETLVGGIAGVFLSALFFTLHHIIAVHAQLGWTATILASIGVFMGGVTWSWCYLKYRSIWPGYVSHLIVDITLYLLGAWLIFGGSGT